MDISKEAPNPIFLFANNHLQTLTEHLFAVDYVAERLLSSLTPDIKAGAETTFIASCLHDLGKIDPVFLEWVRNPKKKIFRRKMASAYMATNSASTSIRAITRFLI